MIGRTISRYRVLERLGTGGMGEVYRAHDERLARDVALKLLRPTTAGGRLDRDRIRAEALTLSQLNHPGISTVYDVESSEGLEFLVLELVEGETLDAILKRGPLPEATVREYGAQIASALAAAHDRGIVHRDLKPANVMISPSGRVKLLDFGLAQHHATTVSPAAETTDGSDPGLLVGTLAYMSPEQLLGRTIDGRSDLYSLGVTLYEMATGRRPFEAELATALINDTLNTEPRAPRHWMPALSEGLSRVIVSLLSKNPGQRPKSAAAAANSLLEGGSVSAARSSPPAGGSVAQSIASLAVLPLTNLSGDSDQEFFADGMTEELILNLAKLQALRVVSRTSVMQFKGGRAAVPEIARALGVDAIVEGSVIRVGDRVRITAQLIDARDDRHLWAQSYERDLRDVLALQSEVARAIAEEIRVQILPVEKARLGRATQVDPAAYEQYLRGRFYWNRRTEEGARKALECFERSIALDPGYAPAYAGLADAYDTLGNYDYLPPHEAFPRADEAVTRALALDDTLAEAHVSLASLRFNARWDWEGALVSFRRALALDPKSAAAHHWFADLLSAVGKVDEAIAEAKEARWIDPLNLIVNVGYGLHLFYGRRYEEAIEAQERTLELDPTFVPALRSLGGALEQAGRIDEAIATYERALALPGEFSAKGLLAHAYAVSGKKDRARELLAELTAASGSRYVAPYSLAAIRVGLGEHDAALELLDRAWRGHDRGMAWLKVSPRFDPLRGHPSFQEILRRLRLDDESIEDLFRQG
ncbi:MAG TPA: protein kinase [Candidatus Eisenbacteria bacterium]|nr:protein kinase [Candidatus Eisenbacteria bacterium]